MRTEENAGQEVETKIPLRHLGNLQDLRHYTLNWRNMLARGIAVVGPTIKLELDVQAMFESHDTPTPPE